jgi:4-hydroxy 2-oxovalerate aldolase
VIISIIKIELKKTMMIKKKMKILDCTLRDGGYYTNWDFDKSVVINYCKTVEKLPIEYIEVGYRSIPLDGYLGEYFYCPDYVLKELKSLMPSKKLTIILNEKDIRASHVDELLSPCIPYISLVRIAVDPSNFERAILLAKAVKRLGFEVAFNVMYMSNWKQDSTFLNLLEGIDDTIDYFYMVDSFGGVFPKDVKEIIDLVKSKTTIPLGFHGHNNLEMAMANTLTAIDEGCSIVDGTITGMGRGAGNLRTELLLTYFESQKQIQIDYTELGNMVYDFEKMKKHYGWGTNLPYMFSGANSLPQKQVMEWVSMNRYSLSSILNALNNQKEEKQDNFKLPILKREKKFNTAIILGGGRSVINHNEALKRFAANNEDTCIIHAGARNVSDYLEVETKQYYTLVGIESDKLVKRVGDLSKLSQVCVYPPFPRKMGTVIPKEIKHLCKELNSINFTQGHLDSLMAIAIQTSLDLGVSKIFLAGFDGYDTTINETQFILAEENQNIINKALKIDSIDICSITPTKYKNIKTRSIYSLL